MDDGKWRLHATLVFLSIFFHVIQVKKKRKIKKLWWIVYSAETTNLHKDFEICRENTL